MGAWCQLSRSGLEVSGYFAVASASEERLNSWWNKTTVEEEAVSNSPNGAR
jgi:hypothetical protein